MKGTHIIPCLLVLCVHGFFLRQELGIFCLQTFDGGQFFQTLLVKELLCRLMQYDFRFMLRKELFGIASLPIGNIGVAGFGVIDDVLLQHFDFRHALLGGLHLGGQGVVLRCDGGSPFFQDASVQKIVFLQIDQRLGKLFQIEVLCPPCVTGTLSFLQLCLNVNQQTATGFCGSIYDPLLFQGMRFRSGNDGAKIIRGIANALIDRLESVLFVGMSDVVNRMQGSFGSDRDHYTKTLMRPDLLILDDLGAGRSTSFVKERVFDVVDKRLLTGKPMIVTTNISLSVMKQAADLDDRRILEVCVPIRFDGENFRKSTAADNLKTAARLLG